MRPCTGQVLPMLGLQLQASSRYPTHAKYVRQQTTEGIDGMACYTPRNLGHQPAPLTTPAGTQ